MNSVSIALAVGAPLGLVSGYFGGRLDYARLVRASVLSARENPYVEAARALGGRDLGILSRYILPNVVAPIIVTATLGLGTAILPAAAFSFLGLGSQGGVGSSTGTLGIDRGGVERPKL